jgi:hypothetical protein
MDSTHRGGNRFFDHLVKARPLLIQQHSTPRLLGLCRFGVWVSLWNFQRIRNGLLPLAGLAAMLLLLPGKEPKPEWLRAQYVERSVAFAGTEYFWGGKSRKGIGCSGLPKRALGDA